MARIGILGGTFDPVHLGHLVMAEEARVSAALERVLFIPAGRPWLKGDRRISATEHRIEMVRRGIAENSHFELCDIEVRRSGWTYTLDTVLALKDQMGVGTELYLILGLDSFLQLPEWHEPRRLVEACRLLVANRPGHGKVNIAALEDTIPGIVQRAEPLAMPDIGISSSDIRRMVRQGRSIRYLVPPTVETYIAEHGLYLG